MNRIMSCMGAHPPGREEVVAMSFRARMSFRACANDVTVDVGTQRLSTPPDTTKERMSRR